MDSSIANIVSLCTGVGMLDEAVRLGAEQLGIRTRLAMCAEWEAYAAACLRSRMEDESMEPAPIWCGDLGGLDCRFLQGLVGILCAGLPCQPYSVAGRQEGKADARSWGDGDGPIPHFLRIVSECQPAVVFIENVPPFVTGIRDQRTGRLNYPFRDVGSVLCRMGYVCEKPLFLTAEAVGASHRRERVFILAHIPSKRFQWNTKQYGESIEPAQQPSRRNDAGGTGEDVGNADARRRRQQGNGGIQNRIDSAGSHMGHTERNSGEARIGEREQQEPGLATKGADRRSEELANAGRASGNAEQLDESRQGLRRQSPEANAQWIGARSGAMDVDGVGLADSVGEGSQGGERRTSNAQFPATERSGQSLFAPGPTADWGSIPEQVWPAIESGFRVLVDGMAVVVDAGRADQLRCGGNGVVAIQGAVAFIELMQRAGIAP